MDNGEWEWGMMNGKWEMGNVKLQMKNGKRGMESKE